MMKNILTICVFLFASAFAERQTLLTRGTKPTIKVGTIGQDGHGKTTLTSAITNVVHKQSLGSFIPVDALESAESKGMKNSPSIHCTQVEYNTQRRRYVHADCETNDDYVNGITSGIIKMNAAILVVSAVFGPQDQTRQQLELCEQAGVSDIVVFLNQCDLVNDDELLELIEFEIRDVLSSYGYSGNDIPIIRGSARKALHGDSEWVQKIKDLLDAMDTHIPTPVSTAKKSFLLPYLKARNYLLHLADKNY